MVQTIMTRIELFIDLCVLATQKKCANRRRRRRSELPLEVLFFLLSSSSSFVPGHLVPMPPSLPSREASLSPPKKNGRKGRRKGFGFWLGGGGCPKEKGRDRSISGARTQSKKRRSRIQNAQTLFNKKKTELNEQ